MNLFFVHLNFVTSEVMSNFLHNLSKFVFRDFTLRHTFVKERESQGLAFSRCHGVNMPIRLSARKSIV